MKRFYALFALLLFTTVSFSQTKFQPGELTGAEANAIWPGAELVWVKQENTVPAYIGFRSGSEPTQEAFFIILRKLYQLPDSYHFELIGTETDELGWIHKRFQLELNNVPVDNGIFILHLVNGRVKKYNGYLFKNINTATNPSVSEAGALSAALTHIHATIYKWQVSEEESMLKMESGDSQATYFPKGALEIIQLGGNESNDFRLAWKFDIYAHEPMSRDYVYIDAQNGEVLNTITRIHHANTAGTALTVYRGAKGIVADSYSGQYRLYETTRGQGIRTRNMKKGTNYGTAVEFLDADNYWNNINTSLDQYAGDAHWGGEMTYDFYSTMGRNSINGSGLFINLYVHYSANYVNAFWDGQRMTFGDGDATYKPLTSLDITGHEISHGLTQYTAGLEYQNESGALNESFSDIFGTAVEWFADSAKANWTIGEDIGTSFRSMSNPKAYSDPNTYTGTYWYTGTGDNGGVHTNSGVQNHWYYILSMGKSGTNDKGNAYNVIGVGMKKANRIAWRNLVNYLTSSSNYTDARFYAIQAAVDLYGPCSPEVEATTKAWYAVGVGNNYVTGVQAAFTASPTTGCIAPMTVKFTNTSTNSVTYIWDFGDGTTSTATNPTKVYATQGSFTVKLRADGGNCGVDSLIRANAVNISSTNPCVVIMPASGTYQTQTACNGTIYDNGGPAGNYSDQTSSTITISPTGASQVRIQFTQFRTESGYDFIYVYNGPNTNSPIIGSYSGTTLPPTITSTGPSITIRQYSDLYVNDAGFTLNWTCILPNTPPVANFTSDVTSSCSGIINFTDLTSGGVSSWLWNFGDGTTSTLKNPTHQYISNGTFTVSLKATNSFGNNTATKTSYVAITKPAAPVANNISRCGPGSASLTANVTAPVTWYDSTGTVVSQSNPFSTPVLNNTRTYWVEDTLSQPIYKVGAVNNSIGSGGNFNTAARALTFNVMKNCRLVSVFAYALGGGYRTVQYRDPAGGVIAERTVYFPDGGNRVTVDIDLIPGSNYELGIRDTLNLYRNSSGAVFPYTDANGMVKITGNNAGSSAPTYYYFFYDWEVKEADCISERKPVTVSINPAVSASISSSSNPTCAANNGTATVQVGGGTPSFTYHWSNGQTGLSASSLGAGTVTVTVTDSKSCSASASQILTPSSALLASATGTDATCFGASNGTIALIITGGTPQYNYSWSGGITTQNRTGLAPGTYEVTVTDGGGCSGTASSTIAQPSPITATIIKTDASCNQLVGSATVSSSGGTGTHTYLWSNNQTTARIASLAAGNYSVIVTDRNSCTASASTVINNNANLTFTHHFAPVTCFGDTNGSVRIQVTNGNAPFTYFWSNGETDSALTNLSAGTYYLTITDAVRCDKKDTIVIDQPDLLNIALNITQPSCNGVNDGHTNIQVTGGTPNYTILWSNGGNSTIANQLSEGGYEVTVTDSHQCQATTTFQIIAPNPIAANPVVQNVSCFGNQDGTINLNPTGGTPEYTYLWSTNVTSPNLEFVKAGNYSVTITDGNHCTASAIVAITEPVELQLNIAITNATNSSDGAITVTVLNGNPQDYYYLWSNGATGATISGLVPGVYGVTITDQNGCEKTVSVTITLTTSTSDISQKEFSFSIYPNPVGNEVTIMLSHFEPNTSMMIKDILGQILFEEKVAGTRKRYDLSTFSTGVYFIEIKQADVIMIKQLVITR
ncbi:MAG: M4 family metallopeptidase [Bacteroidetes bacterium]|nr:M4 family metallopeptidase [Bacteroidota bacterium]